jgi:S-adenosylmethionine/arginine decarboxylase-like enzyme
MLKHKHLILALDCKYPPKDAEEMKAFISFLIKRVDMNVAKSPELLSNPMAYYCGCPGNEGVTGVGILETSHTAVHSWDSEYPAKLQVDLYSCKEFDVPFVIDLCNSFSILKGTFMVIDRDTELNVIVQGKLGENGVIING